MNRLEIINFAKKDKPNHLIDSGIGVAGAVGSGVLAATDKGSDLTVDLTNRLLGQKKLVDRSVELMESGELATEKGMKEMADIGQKLSKKAKLFKATKMGLVAAPALTAGGIILYRNLNKSKKK